MIGTARPRKYTYILPLCLFTLLLAIAWPAPAAAQPADLPPGEAGATTWWCTPDPSPGPPTGPPSGGGGTPTPTPPPPPPPHSHPRPRQATPSRQTRQAATVTRSPWPRPLPSTSSSKPWPPIASSSTPPHRSSSVKWTMDSRSTLLAEKERRVSAPGSPPSPNWPQKHPDGDEASIY